MGCISAGFGFFFLIRGPMQCVLSNFMGIPLLSAPDECWWCNLLTPLSRQGA
ncbi:hypothetical protein M407DRAFT_240996, partial [Tulasnella calospora MUT 4182]